MTLLSSIEGLHEDQRLSMCILWAGPPLQGSAFKTFKKLGAQILAGLFS